MTERPLPCPAPVILPEVAPYWKGTTEGRLVLPRCPRCEHLIWYPRSFCPACTNDAVEWTEVSGRGRVYSFTINRRGEGLFAPASPYVLAYVELDEGPRVMTNLVGCDPDGVRIGLAVKAVFHESNAEASILRFQPWDMTEAAASESMTLSSSH